MVLNFGICQVLIIIIYALSLGMTLARHGKPMEGKYNFWVSLVSIGIIFVLLWFGGFFWV